LDFLPAFIQPKFGNAMAKPFFLMPGVPTPVTITVYIPDPNLVPDSVQLKESGSSATLVIGTLSDTGNKVFSITTNLQKANSGVVRLSISATFDGITRTVARFPISVFDVPTIQNAGQYNQIFDNIFSTLVASQKNFKALKNPTGNPQTFLTQLRQAQVTLSSVCSSFEAIYRAETHSPSNLPRAAASLLGIGDCWQAAQDIISLRELFRDNPNDHRVANILAWGQINWPEFLNTPPRSFMGCTTVPYARAGLQICKRIYPGNRNDYNQKTGRGIHRSRRGCDRHGHLW
jgi:hypothetical protein